MQVKNLVVEEIKATKVNSKNKTIDVEVKFANESPISTTIVLEENLDKMAFKLLRWIKDSKKDSNDNFEGGFLSGLSLVHIDNHEDIEEIAPKGFYRISNRISNFKRITDPREYMRAYGQIQTQQEIIYRRTSSRN